MSSNGNITITLFNTQKCFVIIGPLSDFAFCANSKMLIGCRNEFRKTQNCYAHNTKTERESPYGICKLYKRFD